MQRMQLNLEADLDRIDLGRNYVANAIQSRNHANYSSHSVYLGQTPFINMRKQENLRIATPCNLAQFKFMNRSDIEQNIDHTTEIDLYSTEGK